MQNSYFLLSRPEYLPASRAQITGGGGSGPCAAAARLVLRSEGVPLVEAVARARAVIGPGPGGTPDEPASQDAWEPEEPKEYAESEHNRTVDVVFGIRRFRARDVTAVIRTVLAGYELLLRQTAATGTALTAEQWRRLCTGFDAYLGFLVPEVPYRPGLVRQAPPPVPAARRGAEAALDRWVAGHRVFLVLVQGLGVAWQCLCDDLARGDVAAARRSMRTLTAVMWGSEAALRYTSDFDPAVYEPVVRPSLVPPRAPGIASGLHLRDHEFLVREMRRAAELFGALDPALRDVHAEFAEALEQTYDSHKFVCERFVGRDRPSILQNPHSRRSAVDVIGQLQRTRLSEIDAPPPVAAVPAPRRPWPAPGSRWLQTFRPARGRCALVCLPYAGGSAGLYRDWQKHTEALDVVAVQLPGRAGRFTEPAVDDLDALAGALLPELAAVDRDYALFGHSMGALLGFELARRIRDAGRPAPRALYVSGFPAPDVPQPPAVYDLPRDELIGWLRETGGIDQEVLDNPELLDLVLPTLRADLAVVDRYAYRPAPPLPWPVYALVGDRDPQCGPGDAEGWRTESSVDAGVVVLPGDHFFLHDAAPRIVALIERGVLAAEGAVR